MSEPRMPPHDDRAPASARPLILVVEDNPDDVLLLVRTLRKANVTAAVRVLTDGEQAIDYLGGEGAYVDRAANPLPSLVLLDYKLPRRSGVEVLDWMAGHFEAATRPPVVVLTASGEPRDRMAAEQAGADRLLVKPVEPATLLGLLDAFELRAAMTAEARAPGATPRSPPR